VRQFEDYHFHRLHVFSLHEGESILNVVSATTPMALLSSIPTVSNPNRVEISQVNQE
jgi:hypothetical protein